MTIAEKILYDKNYVKYGSYDGVHGMIGHMMIPNNVLSAMKQVAWNFYSERQRHIAKLTDLAYDEEYTRIIFEEEWNKQI